MFLLRSHQKSQFGLFGGRKKSRATLNRKTVSYRFTKLEKTRPVRPAQIGAASEKNRKLVAQLSERPAVKAALDPRKAAPPKRVTISTLSLRQQTPTGV